jgi:hypothetical protein
MGGEHKRKERTDVSLHRGQSRPKLRKAKLTDLGTGNPDQDSTREVGAQTFAIISFCSYGTNSITM